MCEKDNQNFLFPVRKAGGSDFKTVHLPIKDHSTDRKRLRR